MAKKYTGEMLRALRAARGIGKFKGKKKLSAGAIKRGLELYRP